ncbi:C protein immunoglobulin-A-binding beta antigen [Penaeus vannamei]|uniref:C protein immunoglobulin-A-binding beta antigen n=1 Tax=Penaeus vannamei TaxID=6689 RepID=A0A423TUB5_PENVA|nr:C protein immunoglobulin-A-binding beta antigen [Penaeus vannamei]
MPMIVKGGTVSGDRDPEEGNVNTRGEDDDSRGEDGEAIQIDPGSPIIGSQRQMGRMRREPSVEIMEDSDEEPVRINEQVTSENVRTSDARLLEEETRQEAQPDLAVEAEQEANHEQAPETEQAPDTPQAPETEQAPDTAQAPDTPQAPETAQAHEEAQTSEAGQIAESRQPPESDEVVVVEQPDPKPGPSNEVTPKKKSTVDKPHQATFKVQWFGNVLSGCYR